MSSAETNGAEPQLSDRVASAWPLGAAAMLVNSCRNNDEVRSVWVGEPDKFGILRPLSEALYKAQFPNEPFEPNAYEASPKLTPDLRARGVDTMDVLLMREHGNPSDVAAAVYMHGLNAGRSEGDNSGVEASTNGKDATSEQASGDVYELQYVFKRGNVLRSIYYAASESTGRLDVQIYGEELAVLDRDLRQASTNNQRSGSQQS
jgi:hypothetical protein